MIARIWHGCTRAEHADAYLDYLKETGVAGYRAVAGNLGVRILRRISEDEADFLVLSLWQSMEAVRGFAGDDLEKAVYYPRDRDYLLELEPHVAHYEVVADDRSITARVDTPQRAHDR
jgi:heme-degrading monooxygenase HmoA